MPLPRLVVFASGTRDGGGSGFEKLVEATRSEPKILNAEIVAVVSNHADGGVYKRAKKLGVKFLSLMPRAEWDAKNYQQIAEYTKGDFFALSGWLKLVKGFDLNTRFNPKTVFNIHPGPLPDYGGPGMHGHHVHEAVIEAFRCGDLKSSAVSMHFVTEEYDKGPVFFSRSLKIRHNDTPITLAERVNKLEHIFQSKITNMVTSGKITWDGVNPASLQYPVGYKIRGTAE